MSDDDLIRRGDVLELLDIGGWVGKTRKWVEEEPAASTRPMIDAAVKAALERAVDACHQAETDWNAIAYEKRQAGKDDNFACASASASRKNAETIRAMIPHP